MLITNFSYFIQQLFVLSFCGITKSWLFVYSYHLYDILYFNEEEEAKTFKYSAELPHLWKNTNNISKSILVFYHHCCVPIR